MTDEEPKSWILALRQRLASLWWEPGDYYLYDLEMQLPGAKTMPIRLRMWPGRS